VVEVILGRIEAAEAEQRARELVSLSEVYETEIGDLARAFEAVTTACQIAPDDDTIAARAEKLATATGNWADLVSEGSEIATEATDPRIASKWWARLGGWYANKLDRLDYAMPSLRRALELDSKNTGAYKALADTHRKAQKWADLAETLKAHAEVETDIKTKVESLIDLGDLYETQLASSTKAAEAYQAAFDLDENNDDTLAALERLYRRDEKWANLAKVLDRRAEIAAEAGDKGRAAAIRTELATLRAEKLGDLEGAIARYEATVAS
jgi:tetratricopeptide (TPR) repeat protein